MNDNISNFQSVLASPIAKFLSYKRALRRRFDVEEAALRLLDRFLVQQEVVAIEQITPDFIDAFLKSRPRKRPRSYNHLLGTVRRLFDWLALLHRATWEQEEQIIHIKRLFRGNVSIYGGNNLPHR